MQERAAWGWTLMEEGNMGHKGENYETVSAMGQCSVMVKYSLQS